MKKRIKEDVSYCQSRVTTLNRCTHRLEPNITVFDDQNIKQVDERPAD